MKELILPGYEVVYLPSNLDIKELLIKHPPNVKVYHTDFDKTANRFALILGQINQKLIGNKHNKQEYKTGVVRLNSEILESLVASYKLIIEWATQHNIIKVNPSYQQGEYSKSYSFTEKYNARTRKYYIYNDSSLIGNIRNRKSKGFPLDSPKHEFLYQCLKEIKINEDKAIKEMKILHANSTENKNVRTRRLESRIAAIENINSNYPYFIIDDRIGRLHTNITGLKKEARKHLLWNSNKLINIDIKNSQPYFSLSLINKQPYIKLGIEKIIKGYNKQITSIMFQEFYDKLGTYSEEYLNAVKDGILYELVANNLGIDRSAAKKVVFNIIFSVSFWRFKNKKLFIALFPNEWELFCKINTGFNKTKKAGRKKSDQSNALALTLQKVESTIFLNHIVPRIIKEIPGTPIWTIHDSIMTIKGEEEKVKNIITDTCKSIIGYAPTVEYE